MANKLFLTLVMFCIVSSYLIEGQNKSGKKAKSVKKYEPALALPVPEKITLNPCSSKETCRECITSFADCAWCAEEVNKTERNWRCDYIHNMQSKCNASYIVSPVNAMSKTSNEELSDKGVSEDSAVQIRPQRITLKLRPNTPYDLKIDFRQAVDYPVDLYYLMDLSNSMKDDKQKLGDLGNMIAEHMGKITQNFRLGFGSFVDKVVMPYVSIVPEKLKEPCTGCAAPYGFINHMPLSTNTSVFAEEVKKANVSGNLDAPEGGFDAIMQAIVCHDQIGWREKSRKMLVFSTDSGFHYAGDGKLGGIVKPNDGKCHLDKNGYYTESSNQDYPSLSQINHKIQKHKVNIIFAVTANQVPIYTRLSEQLEGSSTGRLENDSSNVVDLVRDQYDKISSSVELKDNATDYVTIKYFSKCLGTKEEQTNICSGLKVGTMVTFNASIKVTSCPADRSEWNQTIQIYPVGINEALIIDLQMICECECEKPGHVEYNSEKCFKKKGDYMCGVCSCHQNRYGRHCECDAKEADEAEDEAACIAPNATLPCSGHGVCRCGLCECNKDREGAYCECSDKSCNKPNGAYCGGPSHGRCVCGTCVCTDEWEGVDCQCSKNKTGCIRSPGEEICSGRGDCVCNECRCKEAADGSQYTGQYCEECLTCPGKCELLKDCVQCYMFGTGELDEYECNNCSFIPTRVDQVEVRDDTEKLCIFRDKTDDCKFKFVYKVNQGNNTFDVRAQRTKDCPPPLNILAIIAGVVLGIVAIGLALLLIWKLLTTIHDRREFAKFEKERQMARWDTGENPIYKQATTTFKNPTYGGK